MPSPSMALPASGIRPTWLWVALSALITALAFARALLELIVRWSAQEEYSHGFVIPLVTLWLLWTRRNVIAVSVDQPAWQGVALIVFALVVHTVGLLSAIFLLSQIAFVLALLGIVLSAGGLSLLRVAAVPILFLLFAIPLPYFIDAHLSLQLQLISSSSGRWCHPPI